MYYLQKVKKYVIVKLNKKLQKKYFIEQKVVRSDLVRKDYLKDLKSSSKINFSRKYYLMDKCINEGCVLVGIESK